MAAKRQRTTSSTPNEFKYRIMVHESYNMAVPTYVEHTGVISLEDKPKVWMLLIQFPSQAFYMKSTGEIVNNGDMYLSDLEETEFICRPYPPSQAYLQKKVSSHFYAVELSKVCDEISDLTMQLVERQHRRDEILKTLKETL